jgi:transposase
MRFCRWFAVESPGGSSPVEFPPASTVYGIFVRWVRVGVWRRIHDALRDRGRVRGGRDRCPTAAVIDSQTVPAADTVPRSQRGWDGGKRTNGVKRHIAVDVCGLLLAVVVTAASIQDRDAAHRLLAALRDSFSSSIRLVWADGGYRGRLVRWAKGVLALRVEIIKRRPGSTGFHVRPRVWVVERTFGWIVKHRRCVRAYETRHDHHEAVIHIAMIGLMTRRLART